MNRELEWRHVIRVDGLTGILWYTSCRPSGLFIELPNELRNFEPYEREASCQEVV